MFFLDRLCTPPSRTALTRACLSGRSRCRRLEVEALEERQLLTTLVALTTGVVNGSVVSELVPFDSSNPVAANTTNGIAITGMQTGDSMAAIAIRPANGQLYGLGLDKTVGHLYTINLSATAAVATLVPTASLTFSSNAALFNMGFDAARDQPRLVDDGGDNFRVDLTSGAVITDKRPTLNGTAFRLGAITYGNPSAGSGPLYGLDLDNVSLVRMDTPDDGTAKQMTFLTGFTQNQGLTVAADGTLYTALVNATVDTSVRLYKLTIDSSGTTATAALTPNDPTQAQIGNNQPFFMSGFAALSPPTFLLNAAGYQVHEKDGSLTVAVIRTGDTSLPGSVQIATTDQSAKNGTDYTDASTTLNFAAGDKRKTVTIPILDDGGSETNDTFAVTLSNPSGGAVIGGFASATVTILEEPMVQNTFSSTTGHTLGVTAGTSLNSALASFTFSNPAATVGSFTATIDWGDGTNGAGSIVANGNGFDVTGPHTYATEGVYTANVALSGPGGATASAMATVHVARTGPPPSTLTPVAAAIANSPEYYTNLIVPAYQKYLNRTPAQSEINYWLDQFNNHGLTDQRLEAGFIGAAEYIGHYATTPDWIVAMYQDLLGRTPADSEVAYWLNQLTQGEKPSDVAYGFAASKERDQQHVIADYQHYLGRTPAQSEVDYWVGQIVNASWTNERVIAGFVGSAESFQDHYNNAIDWLYFAYPLLLGRPPDASGLQHWAAVLEQS
jgi:hypothetical protein